jgi:hypothetical protein
VVNASNFSTDGRQYTLQRGSRSVPVGLASDSFPSIPYPVDHPCTVTQQAIGTNPCLATNISANHSSTTLPSITKQGTRPLDYAFWSRCARRSPALSRCASGARYPASQEQVWTLDDGLREQDGNGGDVVGARGSWELIYKRWVLVKCGFGLPL